MVSLPGEHRDFDEGSDGQMTPSMVKFNTKIEENEDEEVGEDQESMVWRPISKLAISESGDDKQDYRLLSQKLIKPAMEKKVDALVKENAEYFRGKEVRIDNHANFFQCIVDP